MYPYKEDDISTEKLQLQNQEDEYFISQKRSNIEEDNIKKTPEKIQLENQEDEDFISQNDLSIIENPLKRNRIN